MQHRMGTQVVAKRRDGRSMAHFKKVDYLTSEETGSWKPRPDASQQEPPKPDADRH